LCDAAPELTNWSMGISWGVVRPGTDRFSYPSLSGTAATPNDVFLKLVDLIVERDIPDLKSKH
jgi:hypothetical protein